MKSSLLYLSVMVIGAILLLFPSAAPTQEFKPDSRPVQQKRAASPPLKIKQGEVAYWTIQAGAEAVSVEGRLRDRSIPFFKTRKAGEFATLVGVDLADPPAREDLLVRISKVRGLTEQRRYTVQVLPVKFGTQELTVPQEYVELDEETLKRVEQEQEKILSSLRKVTEQRLWEESFIMPVEGRISGSFGLSRMMNGQPRSPHSGEDIHAPKGTPVHATNAGAVGLVGDFFFSGKSVVLDHGLGVYTMYFHLDAVDVKEGDSVRKGDVIGTVGATGRATGPHLHWGMRVNGARVNPLSVLKIK